MPGPVAVTSVRGVTLHKLTVMEDSRGKLAAGEFGQDIPFVPKRFFTVFGVPGKEVRGAHAHRRCAQFLVCVFGSVRVLVDDGMSAEEILLEAADTGLFVPPMTWGAQFEYSNGAVLLVFASEHYDATDYIRDREEFKKLSAQT